MLADADYELLDFGEGRKLERLGAYRLDRPCPTADGIARQSPSIWNDVDARFERRDDGSAGWSRGQSLAETWPWHNGSISLELKFAPSGQVGVFPEQATNWTWLDRQIRGANAKLKVLNLFAYTGASTLAATAAGAEVVHVDAASSVVAWARRNAELSSLADAPIRWIAEDALKFAHREVKRGNKYDAVILDPPSYGHGPHGEVWQIERDLPRLLEVCAELTHGRLRLALVSCHSPGFPPERLVSLLGDVMLGDGCRKAVCQWLDLVAVDGRRLRSGAAARWSNLDDASQS